MPRTAKRREPQSKLRMAFITHDPEIIRRRDNRLRCKVFAGTVSSDIERQVRDHLPQEVPGMIHRGWLGVFDEAANRGRGKTADGQRRSHPEHQVKIGEVWRVRKHSASEGKPRTFTAELAPDGMRMDSLGTQPLLRWEVFSEVVRLLGRYGGVCSKGDAMKGRLGDALLPLEPVEGHVAHVV